MNKKLSSVEVAYHVISKVTKAIHCAVPDREMPSLVHDVARVIEQEKLESRIEVLEEARKLDPFDLKDKINQLKAQLEAMK